MNTTACFSLSSTIEVSEKRLAWSIGAAAWQTEWTMQIEEKEEILEYV